MLTSSEKSVSDSFQIERNMIVGESFPCVLFQTKWSWLFFFVRRRCNFITSCVIDCSEKNVRHFANLKWITLREIKSRFLLDWIEYEYLISTSCWNYCLNLTVRLPLRWQRWNAQFHTQDRNLCQIVMIKCQLSDQR